MKHSHAAVRGTVRLATVAMVVALVSGSPLGAARPQKVQAAAWHHVRSGSLKRVPDVVVDTPVLEAYIVEEQSPVPVHHVAPPPTPARSILSMFAPHPIVQRAVLSGTSTFKVTRTLAYKKDPAAHKSVTAHLGCNFSIYDSDGYYWNFTYEARLYDPSNTQIKYGQNWDYKPGINGILDTDLTDPDAGDYSCTVHWWVETYDLGIEGPVYQSVSYAIPTSETSFHAGWGSGTSTTIGLFTALLSPNKFDGRSVHEETTSPGTDGCKSQDTSGPVPIFNAVTGGPGWSVSNGSSYGPDGIGWNSNGVDYYRGHVSIPCETNFDQKMWINYPGHSNHDVYQTNAIRYKISSSVIEVWRDGTHATKSY